MDDPQAQAADLLRLVPTNLKPRTKAEELLLTNVVTGEMADCSKLDDKGVDPKQAKDWTKERHIRAELLPWLCGNQQARKYIHNHGIQVYAADITGPLDLTFASVPFQLELNNCRLQADIDLGRAEVSQLVLQGSFVQGITADGLIVKNDVILGNGFNAKGEARLLGAQIGGDLDCSGGSFTNENGMALSADRIVVKGSVFLKNGRDTEGNDVPFTANGEVRLLGAQIGGNLECDGGIFTNQNGIALNADGIVVKASVFLRNGFTAKGAVVLRVAQIGGQIDCSGGHFTNSNSDALNAERAIVKSSTLLRDGFTADGRVNLIGTQIGAGLDCNAGDFQNATLDLTEASAASLFDTGLNDYESEDLKPTLWPRPDYLYLNGFTYGRISSYGRVDVDKRLDWLALQSPSPFHPQPYMQLAKVLRESGDPDGAKKVLIAMEDLSRQDDSFGLVVRPLLRWTIGYGHDPIRAFWWAAGLSALGWIIYRRSYLAGAIAPTEEKAHRDFTNIRGAVPAHYPRFSPLIYSIENSLPLVKLGQGDKWQPDPPGQSLLPKTRSATEFAYRWARRWVIGAAILVLALAIWSQFRFAVAWIRSLDFHSVAELVYRGKWRLLACAVLVVLAFAARKPLLKWSRSAWAWTSVKTTTPQFVMWFLWFQILLGWLLATLFVAGVSGIVHKE